MRREKSEYLLLYHCAPTLLGKKSASLFSLSGASISKLPYILNTYSHLISSLELKVTILCRCEKNALVYVYNEQQLKRILDTPTVSDFLKKFGYANCKTVSDYIELLKTRFDGICKFPHEIGIFLDYPLYDVIGFIQNKGKSCICCGDWKVYGNKTDALRRFDIYRQCRSDIYKNLKSGLSAEEILSEQAFRAG